MYSATLFAGSYVNAVSLKNFGATRCYSLERCIAPRIRLLT